MEQVERLVEGGWRRGEEVWYWVDGGRALGLGVGDGGLRVEGLCLVTWVVIVVLHYSSNINYCRWVSLD